MDKTISDKFFHGNLGLVIGTWVLVLGSLLSTWLVKNSMDEQVSELKKATELQWRPFLHIEHIERKYHLRYSLGANFSTSTVSKSFDSLKISSTEFMAVRDVEYVVPSRVRLHNLGTTPLNIFFFAKGSMTKKEWFNDLGRSPEKLVSTYFPKPKNYESDTSRIDIVILPDSSKKTPEYYSPKKIDIKSFMKLLKEEKEVILYNITYIEYEDFYNNSYNTLLVEHIRIPLSVENELVKFGDSLLSYIHEVYRWDISLDE